MDAVKEEILKGIINHVIYKSQESEIQKLIWLLWLDILYTKKNFLKDSLKSADVQGVCFNSGSEWSLYIK